MTKEEKLYVEIGESLNGTILSKMFGKPSLKVNGKAFACLHDNCMVFKLNGDTHKKAIALSGTCLFDPSDMGRPMKEWVQVPYTHKAKWKELATAAFNYVESATK